MSDPSSASKTKKFFYSFHGQIPGRLALPRFFQILFKKRAARLALHIVMAVILPCLIEFSLLSGWETAAKCLKSPEMTADICVTQNLEQVGVCPKRFSSNIMFQVEKFREECRPEIGGGFFENLGPSSAFAEEVSETRTDKTTNNPENKSNDEAKECGIQWIVLLLGYVMGLGSSITGMFIYHRFCP